MLFTGMLSLPVFIACWATSPHIIPAHSLLKYVLLLILTFLSSCVPVFISDKRFALSPTLPMTMAANYLLGPFAAVSIALFNAILTVFLLMGSPLSVKKWNHIGWSVLMNVAMCIIATGIPSLLFSWLYTHHLFVHHSFSAAALLCVATFFSFYINALVSTILASIFTKTRWDVIWYQSYRWTWVSTVLLAPLGFLMGALMEQNVVYGLIFILMPLVAVHQGYSRHEREIATYRQGIDLLGRLMQESHPYTHGHLNRVATWAVKIAEHLNLGAESMAQIENAAILHDIGKIAIDDGILNKVEKLTDDEWNKIKDHPSVGAEIAARMKYLEQVSLWIRHHHERVDGKGYPAGLAGDSIPIESKIICVVDAFDAMVGGPAKSDQRPYRLPKTVEEARQELVRCSGSQFDEIVVNAFLAILEAEAVEERAAQMFGTADYTLSSAMVASIPAAAAALAATDAASSATTVSINADSAPASALSGSGAGSALQEAA